MDMTLEQKVRLFNGEGAWSTFTDKGEIPGFIMSDGPHGLRKQDQENYANINKSRKATCFPTASCMASGWSRENMHILGEALSREANSENVDLLLGPGINIKRSPLCGRNFEYLSEDPYLAGELASCYVKGLQESGTGACVKHFACNNQETRRQTSNSIVDLRTLNEIFLAPFEKVIKNSSPVAVMESYNRVNGEYVCRSNFLLKEILRKKWKYSGLVISDWGACLNPSKCLKAGMDLAMPDSNGFIPKKLYEEIENGNLSESLLDKANERIINQAVTFRNRKKNPVAVDYRAQHQISLKLAQEGAVLLKNDGILPLKPKSRVIVFGDFAKNMKFQGEGSSHINTETYPDAVESLETLGFSVQYCDCKNIARVKEFARLAFAKNIPVLYFCGLDAKREGEGFDRTTLELPDEQKKMIELLVDTGCKVVLVNFSGAPVIFPCVKKVAAILQMYLCGEACGQACANLLSGKVNPSGHLAETFPLSAEDVPCSKDFAHDNDNVEYNEGVFVGYRYYSSFKVPVQFEFGHGLSYTTFEYSEMQLEALNGLYKVSFNLKNTGELAGAEVCQVYVVNCQESQGARPRKELRGFEKVYLEPGETRRVEIILDERAFMVYGEKEDCFKTVGGKYSIQVGSSLFDIHLSEEVEIAGEKLSEVLPDVQDCNRFGVKTFPKEWYVPSHKKGEFTIEDSLETLASYSKRVKFFLSVMIFAVRLMNFGKSKDDPVVVISVNAIKENPLASLISTSGGAISEGLAQTLVRFANGK